MKSRAAYSRGTAGVGKAGCGWCAEPVSEDGLGRLQAPQAVAASTRGRFFDSGVLHLCEPRRGGFSVEVVHPCCAGIDVHKRTVVACVLDSAADGSVSKQVRTFGTMLAELEALRDWLVQASCDAVAMEATGVYWKPVVNVLEGQFEIVVANAEHMRAVPGRKTDVNDAEWIASLLRHGLLRSSFIPEREQREWRELTRYRTALLQDRARAVNRLQKTLEGANIKLAAVLTDITGVSGQRILTALLQGQDDPEALAGLAHHRLSSKREALQQAVRGQLSARLRFVVSQQLQQIQMLDEQIAACDQEVAEQLRPFAAELARLDAIPGVGQRTAEVMVSEMGVDLRRFPTSRHLAAWAGVCPGNKASGGKARPARTRRGNPWLKRALTEAAWAAGRSRNTFLGEQYRRFAARKGRKRAVVVVGHSILVIAYCLLTRGVDYVDLGSSYLDERHHEGARRAAVQRLQSLGYDVHLSQRSEAA
jgi:transposase